MTDIPLKEYVDKRFEELDKRVGALNSARERNAGSISLAIAILALLTSVIHLLMKHV